MRRISGEILEASWVMDFVHKVNHMWTLQMTSDRDPCRLEIQETGKSPCGAFCFFLVIQRPWVPLSGSSVRATEASSTELSLSPVDLACRRVMRTAMFTSSDAQQIRTNDSNGYERMGIVCPNPSVHELIQSLEVLGQCDDASPQVLEIRPYERKAGFTCLVIGFSESTS